MIDFENSAVEDNPELFEKALVDFRNGDLSAEDIEACLLEATISSKVLASVNEMVDDVVDIIKGRIDNGMNMEITLAMLKHLNRVQEADDHVSGLK